MLTRKQC